MTALDTDQSGGSSTDVRFVPADGPCPWVDIPGGKMRILRVNLDIGEWVVHNIFEPGFSAPRHKHTGHIDAYTIRGSWQYLEYGVPYEAGSFVYEPAFSVHTLHVPAEATEPAEVIFIMRGANLNLDADGNVESITDAESVVAAYAYLCQMQGLPAPAVLR
jgi:hypothetical protein